MDDTDLGFLIIGGIFIMAFVIGFLLGRLSK